MVKGKSLDNSQLSKAQLQQKKLQLEKRIAELASNIKAYIVPEINMGQIGLEVERCAHGKTNVIPVTHPGGGLHSPQQILEVIRRAAK